MPKRPKTVHQKLIEIVSDVLGVKPAVVTLTKRLVEDLAADATDMADLIIEIEERFNKYLPRSRKLKITDGDASGFVNVQAIFAYLQDHGVTDQDLIPKG